MNCKMMLKLRQIKISKMRKMAILLLVVALAGCQQQDNDRSEIRKQLAQYRKEKNELEQKINQLTNNLSEMEGSGVVENRVPVLVKQMNPEPFNHYVRSNGSVEAVYDAFISPETNGQITEIYVDEGDRVSKGELLVSLKTSVIRSNIQEVKTNLELARKTYEKQKNLWQDSVGSEMQYLEARNRRESLENRLSTLQEQLEMSQIRAPFDGVVESINQKVGELGTPGLRLLHLVNLKNLKVEAQITEQYIARIEEGDTVQIRFPSYPEETRRVPITRKGSVIDEEARTFTIEARLGNPREKIRPNQIAIVNVRDYAVDSAMVVPSNIIKQDMQGDYVYVVDNEQQAHKVYVETGRSYNNQTVLVSGVEAGDRVITSGYTQVSESTPVAIKEKEDLIR